MLYDAQKKSVIVAYLFWFFLGGIGAHRFYLKRTRSAIAILLLSVIGAATVIIGVGSLLLGLVGLWLLVDLVLIPGITRQYNMALANELGAAEASNVKFG